MNIPFKNLPGKLICLTCTSLNQKSIVTVLEQRTHVWARCLPFYDEGGVLHYHDKNTTILYLSCSNGHHFEVVKEPEPCQCGWKKGDPDLCPSSVASSPGQKTKSVKK
jgi:hypothetical protein